MCETYVPDKGVWIWQTAEMLLHLQFDLLQGLLLPQMSLELLLFNAAQLDRVMLPDLLVYKDGRVCLQTTGLSQRCFKENRKQTNSNALAGTSRFSSCSGV